MDYIKTELKPYQKESVIQAQKYSRFIFCFDPGAGKSLASLALFAELKEKNGNVLCLIVAPKTALATWCGAKDGEIIKHTRFSYSEGRVSSAVDISVISYSRLKENLSDILSLLKTHKVMLVLDEVHLLRSKDSDLAIFLRKFITLFQRVYGLSATPVNNHIEDTYFFYNSLFPGIFGPFQQFMNRYTERVKKKSRYGSSYYEVKSFKHIDELQKIIAPTMYRYSVDYKLDFSFPSTIFTPEEEAIYGRAAKGVLEGADSFKEFVTRLPSLQLAVNNSIDINGEINNSPELSSKEKLLVSVLNEIVARDEGVVVFTFFKLSYHRLAKVIQTHCKFNRFYSMSGDTDLFLRKAIVDDFKQGDVLVSTMVGSQSLNIQEANNVVFFDLPWSTSSFVQAAGRIARMNSRFPIKRVYVPYVEGSIDYYKQLIVRANLALINQVIGGVYSFNKLLKDVSRKYIISMRRELLWRFVKKSVKSAKE